MSTGTDNARQVAKIVTAHRQREGGGFIVGRPFPSGGLRHADPFLLLDEMAAPHYQEIPRTGILEAATPDGLAAVRVIAGRALGASAVIETRTPIGFLHWTFAPGASVAVPVPPDHAAYVYVFAGAVGVAGHPVRDGQLAVLDDGDTVHLEAGERAQALLLSGVPLREPVVQYGPFVMNSEREIREAIEDYQSGRLGEIAR
jgi:quercetin 2,3-dioxygenase